MFFNAGQTESALGATVPEKAPAEQNRNLSKDQFGKAGGNPTEGESPMEGGAGAGAGEAGAAGAGAAGGAEAAELLPLLLV